MCLGYAEKTHKHMQKIKSNQKLPSIWKFTKLDQYFAKGISEHFARARVQVN